jgi:hypothetical protein
VSDLISDVLDAARRFREAAEMAHAMREVKTVHDDDAEDAQPTHFVRCPKCLAEVDVVTDGRCDLCWDEFNRDYEPRRDNFRGEF